MRPLKTAYFGGMKKFCSALRLKAEKILSRPKQKLGNSQQLSESSELYVKTFHHDTTFGTLLENRILEVRNKMNVGFEIKVSGLTSTISQTIQCDRSGSWNENPVPQNSPILEIQTTMHGWHQELP